VTHLKKGNLRPEIASKLTSILRKISGSRKIIGDKTRLYHDLKICGDDVSDLVKEIETVFGVALPEIDSSRYFPDEGTVASWWLFSLLTSRTPLNSRYYEAITFERIRDAISGGHFQ
jgi:hypothetical protein